MGLTLIATPRPSERDRGNLFVRLAPQTARKLASSLLFSPHPSHGDDDGGGGGEKEVCDVDFLPLEIVIFPKGVTSLDGIENGCDGCIILYSSYNGGAPAAVGPRSNVGIIELPLDLHPSLHSVFNSTSEPVLASVRPVSNVPIAERVSFEPLTVSDWEMIEMECNILEDGGLLNQITVVSLDQVLPLRFGGRLGTLESAAWIKVVDDGFVTSSNRSMNTFTSDECDASFTSDSEFDSSTDISCDDDHPRSTVSTDCHQCVRLMAETEVVIIPKPRMRKEETIEDKESMRSPHAEPIHSPSSPLRVQPISSDIFQTHSIDEESLSLPDPSLGFVSVHPSTLIQLPGYQQCMAQCCPNDQIDLPPMVVTIRKLKGPYAKYSQPREAKREETASNIAVAIVYASNCMHGGHIGINRLLRYQLGVTPLSDWVSIQVWSESNVVNSISGVRDNETDIEISIATQHNRHSALHLWNSPEGFSTMPTSERFENPNVENTNVSPRVPKKIDPVFSSGSLVPADFLRGLGLDWLDRRAELFTLKIHPVLAHADDSFNRIDCPLNSSSGLLPIITARDLKKLSASNVRLGKDDADNAVSLELNNDSFMVPISEESSVGFTSAIHSVVKSSRQIIYHPTIANASLSIRNHAVMITGDEGSGKTHLSKTSASQLCISDLFATVYLDCKKLQATSANIQIILEQIQLSFQEALHKQPSILVLDDLDALIPNVEYSNADGDGSIHHHQLNPALVFQVKVIVDHLLLQSRHCSRFFGHTSSSGSNGVVLICTCRDEDSLSTRYKESGLFHSMVEVPSLDSPQRAQFLVNKIFRNVPRSNDTIPHAISRLGKDTDGFRPKDLKIVATRIVHQHYLRSFHDRSSEPSSTIEARDEKNLSSLEMLDIDIASILDNYSPLSQQLADIEHNLCSMDWTSIGGLYKARQSLHDIIIHPMKFKSVYDNAPMALPTGILLYGPPGNGKSFIVPLIAKKAKLTLITCRGPELLDRYIGASEAKVRQLFARATAAAPSMIFFDEFDSLAPQRGSDHTGVTDRVVNQLLTLLDGAERSKKANHIYVVAATSRPDKIDKALLRPGRLEKHVYVGYPENLSEWNSLFSSLLLDTRNVDDEVSRIQQGGNCHDSFCQGCAYARDFSAADMKAVLDTARLLCVHEVLDANDGGALCPAILRKCHILEAFRRTRPSLLPSDRQMLQSIYASFGDHRMEEDSYGKSGRGLKTSLR